MYKEITDCELVYLVRCDNVDARDYLIERYRKRIYGIIDRFKNEKGIKSLDYEDCYQTLMIVFLNCLELFDNGSNFYSYVSEAVHNKLLKLYKKYIRENRLLKYDVDALDSGYYDFITVNESKASYEAKETEEYLNSKLNDKQREVLDYSLLGYSGTEISKKLGISQKAYYKRLSKIRKIMEDRF